MANGFPLTELGPITTLISLDCPSHSRLLHWLKAGYGNENSYPCGVAVREILRVGDPLLWHVAKHLANRRGLLVLSLQSGDGVLFSERLSNPTAFGFIPELEAAGVIPPIPNGLPCQAECVALDGCP